MVYVLFGRSGLCVEHVVFVCTSNICKREMFEVIYFRESRRGICVGFVFFYFVLVRHCRMRYHFCVSESVCSLLLLCVFRRRSKHIAGYKYRVGDSPNYPKMHRFGTIATLETHRNLTK